MNGYGEAIEHTNKRINDLRNYTWEANQIFYKSISDLIDQVNYQNQIIEILVSKLDKETIEKISKIEFGQNS